MARPRNFDEQEVLQCAMLTFWRLGFDATTLRELERRSGVGIRSLHNTFGEKEELFVRALETYRHMVRSLLEQTFEAPGVEAVARLFEAAAQPMETDTDPRGAGCLVVNSVLELPELGEAPAREVAAYRAMFIETFKGALKADHIEGADEKAEYLLGSLWGLLSQIRLARDTRAAAPMAKVLADTVRSWAT